MKYYIKKLRFQELGSPSTEGKRARGRYLLISKKTEGFFPPLSKTQFNDAVLIPIVKENSDEKIYCTFKYHNSAFHPLKQLKRKHNEYRLYLNQKIDPDKSFFHPEDIIVFNRLVTEDLIPVFELFLIKKGELHYDFLLEIINENDARGGHVLYGGMLPFLSEKTIKAIDNLKTVIPDEVKKDVSEIQNSITEEDISDLEQTKGANLFNSVSFRDFVLLGYQNKCAITSESIIYEKLVNLEAAHIKPKSHTGSFLPCNGIAMSRDMHWAFDI